MKLFMCFQIANLIPLKLKENKLTKDFSILSSNALILDLYDTVVYFSFNSSLLILKSNSLEIEIII